MSNIKQREFDLVILGATGFTGGLIVRELVLSIEQHPDQYASLKWAIAGRNLTKLNEVLHNVGTEVGKDLSGIVKIWADVSDQASLVKMAQRTKLVLNSVGPYRLYGTPVVHACVLSSTDHIDISGETTYIEGTQLEYDGKSKLTRCLVISACGWDTIPADLGVDFLKKHFPGKLHSVDYFMSIQPGPEGYSLNFGTFHSVIYFMSEFFQYISIHSRLYAEVFTKRLPKSAIKNPLRIVPFAHAKLPGWNMISMGDKDVVERTQHYNYEQFNERPIQIQTYFNVNTFVNLLKILVLATIIAPLSFFKAGLRLLERYPETFTLGFFNKSGPTREQCESTRFTLRLIGKGWSTTEKGDDDDPKTEPSKPLDKEMSVIVSGRDPAYLVTSTCVVQSALTIFAERDKMPRGGVLTPASAFRDTKLVERLQSRQVKFEIIHN